MFVRTVLKLLVTVLLIIMLFCNVLPASDIELPAVPCPNVFKYEFDGNKYVGIVTLSGVSFGKTMIQVKMVYPGNHTISGRLSLDSKKEQIVYHIKSCTPIVFRAEFPHQNVVPRVTDITVNDNKMCFVPKTDATLLEGLQQTTLTMTLNLTVNLPSAEQLEKRVPVQTNCFPRNADSPRDGNSYIKNIRSPARIARQAPLFTNAERNSPPVYGDPFLSDVVDKLGDPAQIFMQNSFSVQGNRFARNTTSWDFAPIRRNVAGRTRNPSSTNTERNSLPLYEEPLARDVDDRLGNPDQIILQTLRPNTNIPLRENRLLGNTTRRLNNPVQPASGTVTALRNVGRPAKTVPQNSPPTTTENISRPVNGNPFLRNAIDNFGGVTQTVSQTPLTNTNYPVQGNPFLGNSRKISLPGNGNPFLRDVGRLNRQTQNLQQAQENPFLRNALSGISGSAQSISKTALTNFNVGVQNNPLSRNFGVPTQTAQQNPLPTNAARNSFVAQDNPFLRNAMNNFGDPAQTVSQTPPFTNTYPSVQENPVFATSGFNDPIQTVPRTPPIQTVPRAPPIQTAPRTPPITTTTTNVKPVTRHKQTNTLQSFCGRENNFAATGLIAKGEIVAESRFPWIVAIYVINVEDDTMKFQCGGNLISSRTVISAAHCFKEGSKTIEKSNLLLSVGRHNLSEWDNAINIGVERLIIHPDFKKETETVDADLALVLLRESVSFSQRAHPVCLWHGPTNDDAIEGTIGSIVGWGEDVPRAGISDVPKLVNATIVSELTCVRSNFELLYLTSNRTLCAGNRDGSGPCKGDSGSGLMVRFGNQWMLRAIVSASLADKSLECNLNDYVIFSDIAKFIEWIKSYMVM